MKLAACFLLLSAGVYSCGASRRAYIARDAACRLGGSPFASTGAQAPAVQRLLRPTLRQTPAMRIPRPARPRARCEAGQ